MEIFPPFQRSVVRAREGWGAFDLWQSGTHDTPCTRMWTLNSPFEINQVSANHGRTRRPQERRWTARRQSQQTPPDTWPARVRLPLEMAAGAGQPHRRTASPACLCCKGADAVHAPAGLTHKPPTEAPPTNRPHQKRCYKNHSAVSFVKPIGHSYCGLHNPCHAVLIASINRTATA